MTASANSFTRTLTTHAAPEAVFEALTDTQAIESWWNATSVTGSGQGGEAIEIIYGSEPDPTVISVLSAHAPDSVVWEVRESPLVPDWVGTRPTFIFSPLDAGTRIDFAHHGLDPDLPCYDRCAVDWGRFLSRIVTHVESVDPGHDRREHE